MEKNDESLIQERGFDLKGFWVRLWKLMQFPKAQIIKLLFLIMSVEIAKLIGPYILKLIIDTITNFNADEIGRVLILAGLMFLANQSAALLAYFSESKIFNIVFKIQEAIANNAQRKMIFLTLGYHERENTGNKITKIAKGVDKIVELLGNVFIDVTPTIFQLFFTTVVLLFIDWRFCLVLFIFVPIFMILTYIVNRGAFPFRRRRHRNQEEASGVLAQSIININTVKSFVQEEREHVKFKKITTDIRDDTLSEYGKVLRFNIGRNLVIDAGRLSIMLLGIFLVWKGSLTLGSLVFIYTVSEKSLFSLYRISRLYDRLMESSEAIERIYDLSVEEPEIKNPKRGIKPEEIEGRIEFKNVSFVYSDSSNEALSNVDAVLQSGCVTALVGPSGGGKTTLARMIFRHYDPAKGEILLDGKRLSDYDLYSFRKFIAIVPQEVEVFNTSIRDNISYAKPDASFEEVQAAARIANAEEFINQLSHGFKTMVGERGIKLSGGQRQRIGIARAILANPRILIFDEATSSLDSHSEQLIQEAMDKISKGRTVIIIAHRLSTIKKADKIIVLEKGKVIEQGSHYELAKVDGGLYQKLIKLQEMGDVD